MRADAQRNRDKILDAAREVFREQGYEASLDEVARRACVGAGTLYRHFPCRENLLDALMQSWMDRVCTAAAQAKAREGDPRQRLTAWFADYVQLISQHKGGAAKLTSALGDDDSPICSKWQSLVGAMTSVIEPDRAALRPGVDAVQLCRLVGGVAVIADTAVLPADQVRPLLDVIVDGVLLAGPAASAGGGAGSGVGTEADAGPGTGLGTGLGTGPANAATAGLTAPSAARSAV